MTQKKLLGSLVLVCFVFLILPGNAGAEEAELQLTQEQTNTYSQMSFGLRLMGGASLLMQNDVNDAFQGTNDLIDDIPIVSADSEFEPINMSLDFSGEILINFMSNFGIGIGAGYITAGKESIVGLEMMMFGSEEQTVHPQFSAVPITFSLYYGIPVGSMMEVVLNAGLGYYLGSVKYDVFTEGTSLGISYETSDTWSAQSNAFGFHGGLNLEFGFSPNMAFVIGARGRYAKFTDLTGDLEWEYSDSWGWSDSGTERDQTLWFGNQEMYGGQEYPQVILSDTKPTGSWWSDVRKAEVNLSGIVFQAGIKLIF
ncbi:MAG: hypothetical protein GF421_10725 [Candidatus Aminicenantes bacterium]|nr:hypothetical protein [Candidatus Aminicenantes bacterium]